MNMTEWNLDTCFGPALLGPRRFPRQYLSTEYVKAMVGMAYKQHSGTHVIQLGAHGSWGVLTDYNSGEQRR